MEVSNSTAVITNTVTTFSLSEMFFSPQRYSWIAQQCVNTEFRPAKFHAIIMRWRIEEREAKKRHTITATIFRSGKVVLCGPRSIKQAKKMALRVCRRVQFALDRGASIAERSASNSRYPRLRMHKFRVRNVVGAMTHPTSIDICHLYTRSCNTNNSSNNSDFCHFIRPRLDFTQFPAFRSAINIHDLHLSSSSSAGNGQQCPINNKSHCVIIFKSGKIIISGARAQAEIHAISIFLSQFIIAHQL